MKCNSDHRVIPWSSWACARAIRNPDTRRRGTATNGAGGIATSPLGTRARRREHAQNLERANGSESSILGKARLGAKVRFQSDTAARRGKISVRFAAKQSESRHSAFDAVDGSPPPCGYGRGARAGGELDGQRYDDWSGYREVSVSSARRGCGGRGGHPTEADPWAGPRVLREAAPMSRRDRGMQLLALLGERTDRTRS